MEKSAIVYILNSFTTRHPMPSGAAPATSGDRTEEIGELLVSTLAAIE
jgi:hypothetical protein